jgi:hypothetical protein
MKINMRTLYKKIARAFLGIMVLIATGTVMRSIDARVSAASNVQPVSGTLASEKISSNVQPVKGVVSEHIPTSVLPSGKLSLEQIHAFEDQKKATTATRGVKSAATIASDRFTQSQAHMSLPEIKKLIAAEYSTKPYEKMIAAILEREQLYKDDYYVFYHGIDNVWRVPQDLYTRLYFYFNGLPTELMKNFIFLRFGDVTGATIVQNFLINKLAEGGLINDHELGQFLFAVNLALFGNVGIQPECTWQYFVKSRGHLVPDRAVYEKILNKFGLSHKYIDELMALVKLYQTKEQTIIQVFVPKNRVDEIGYLSWIRGNPAHKKTMDMVLRSVENKTFSKTSFALDHYTKLFKKDQANNPVFRNLVDRVKAGDFSLGYFLHFYRNHPESIEGINNYQARLMLTPAVLLNPLSGVKIFRYSAATPEQLNNYEQKFNEIFKKIIAEKEQGKKL